MKSAPREECYNCSGCMLSTGRFAVLGGIGNGATVSSCETLVVGAGQHWAPLLGI